MSKKLSTDKSNQRTDLGYLGTDFQYKLVKLFIEDTTFFTQINSIVDQNMFTEDTLRRIVGFIKDRYNDSGVPPSYVDLELYVRTKVYDVITLDTILSTINLMREADLIGQDIVKDEADKFFKQQNLTKAINQAVEIVKSGNVSRYYDIETIIKQALETNTGLDMGYNPMEGIDEALEENYRRVIPTGFTRLDKSLYGGLGSGELGVIIAPSGVGKAQPLSARILTPNGYKTIGQMIVGDKVIGRDGKPYNVSGVFHQGVRPIYKVTLENGSSCECDEEHLWPVVGENGKLKTITTKDMLQLYSIGKVLLPKNECVEFNEDDSIENDPYILGYYFGTCCMFEKDYTVVKPEDIKIVLNKLKPIVSWEKTDTGKNKLEIIKFDENTIGTLKTDFIDVGKRYKALSDKYLFNSSEVRLELLRGIMDAIGKYSVEKEACRIYNGDETLIHQVKWLVESLGGTTTLSSCEIPFSSHFSHITSQIRYELLFNMPNDEFIPFHRPSKAKDFKTKSVKGVSVSGIEYVGDKEAQCIMVDSEEHLYLTEDFIVTHNTSVTTGFAAAAATYQCEDNDYKGYKVLHIHFEDEDVNIKRKYYGWITDIDAIDLSKPENKEHVRGLLKSDYSKEVKMIKDNIWCFHLRSGEVNVNQIDQLVKQGIARGFKPDLVIIDYFECLEHDSTEKSDSEWTKEGKTMRKLEALAHKHEVALWCPIQGTKDSFDKEVLGLSSGGGSVKKIQIGHVIITLARTQEQKINHRVTVSLEKFRAGRMDDSVIPNVKFNNGTCRFEVDEEQDEMLDYIARQETSMREIKESTISTIKKNRNF